MMMLIIVMMVPAIAMLVSGDGHGDEHESDGVDNAVDEGWDM